MIDNIDIDTSDARLLKLADFLDQLPNERFDYAIWAGHNWKGDPSLNCGTTACALGWATAIPEFQALGLHLVRSGGEAVYPVCGPFAGESAAVPVFGIDEAEAEYLFCPASHLYALSGREPVVDDNLPPSPPADATPSEVAHHIRSFVSWRRSQQ